MEWLLELVLIGLLAATLFHAIRLERALGVLKRDRAALQELISGFNESTQAAEQGINRLRAAADGAGRGIARQIEIAQGLRDDLNFLSERGDGLADRLEQLVRAGKVTAQDIAPQAATHFTAPAIPVEPPAARFVPPPTDEARPRSQAERDLLRALRIAR